MKIFKKILPVVALIAATLLPIKTPAESLELGLFPEVPIHRDIMVDPDIPKTEVDLSNGIETILNTPVSKLYPYLSIANTFPLLSLDLVNHEASLKEIKENKDIESLVAKKKLAPSDLSISLIASEQMTVPDGENLNYKGRLELFLNSPMIDQNLSDGNRLYLVGGIEKLGSMDLSGIENKTIPTITRNLSDGLQNYTNLFADIYIVPHSPYSNQFLILRAGFENLLDPNKTDFHISTTWEFPSIFSDYELFKNFKVSPYISAYMGTLTKNIQVSNNELSANKYGFSGQVGLKAWGKNGKSIILYAQIDSNTNQQPLGFSSGLKFDFFDF